MNYAMQLGVMDWSQVAQNEQFSSQNHGVPTLPNLTGQNATARAPYTATDQMMYGKLAGDNFDQIDNGDRLFSQLHLQTIHLLCGVRKELLSEIQSNSNTQLSPEFDSQYEKRREMQQFLANLCTDPTLYRYVASFEFLANMIKTDTPKFFAIVERLTGLDVTKFRKPQNGTRNNAMPHQVQLNQNVTQVDPYADPLHNQIATSFGQFQVLGSGSTESNGGMSCNQMNGTGSSGDAMVYQTIGPIQNISESIQSEDISRLSAATQKIGTSYKMPNERCDSGRVVEQTNNCQGSQEILTAASFHKAGQQQRQGIPMIDSSFSWKLSENGSGNISGHVQIQPRSGLVYGDASRRGNETNIQHGTFQSENRMPLQDQNTTVCSDESEKLLLETTNSEEHLRQMLFRSDCVSTEHDSNRSHQCTETQSIDMQHQCHNDTTHAKVTADTEVIVLDCSDSDEESCPTSMHVFCENVAAPKGIGNCQESVILPKDTQTSHGDCLTESLQKMKNTIDETYKSQGEYDPPLPVIIHKKREDRICPSKTFKNSSNTKVEKSSQSHYSIHKADRNQYDHGGQQKSNREPLFSVLDNLITEGSEHQDRKKSSSISKHEEKHQHVSHHKHKDHKHWSVSQSKEKQTYHDKEKRRHKSGDMSSSGVSKCHGVSGEYRKSGLKHHEKQNRYHSVYNKTERRDHGRSNKKSEKTHMDKYSSDKNKKQKSGPTVGEKVFSKLSEQRKKNEKNKNKLHRRVKSLPDQREFDTRPNKVKRSQTWNGSSISIDSTKNTCLGAKQITESIVKSFPNRKFVRLHGQKLLLVTITEGQYIVTREMIATCLSDHKSTEVYRCKTSELDINNRTLTHSCRKDVQKYLSEMNINCPSQIDIMSLSNAQRLFHHLKDITSCDQKTCISMQPLSVPSLVLASASPDAGKKDRSASPDSTVPSKPQLTDRDDSKRPKENTSENDLQQNKVSSQSYDDMEDSTMVDDDQEDDASSSVSDATDIYCDGKPLLLQSLSENFECDGDNVSKIPLDIELGGLAVFCKENSADKYLRFVIVRGNKCFLYQDLFRLFGQCEVVKVVVNNSMQVKTCTPEEAEYFNRNQPDLIPVDTENDSLIHEKYARKVFAYFGETFPKLKLPIYADLKNIKSSLKQSENHDCQTPAKKSKQNERTDETVELSGYNTKERPAKKGPVAAAKDESFAQNTEKAGRKRKLEDMSDRHHYDNPVDKSKQHTVRIFPKLKSHNFDLAAEITALKATLQETKKDNSCLIKRCKTYEADLTEVKRELKVTISRNTDLELKFRKQEDKLSHLKANLEMKKEENQSLQKERDHCLDFIKRITDAYKVADNIGNDTSMCEYQE